MTFRARGFRHVGDLPVLSRGVLRFELPTACLISIRRQSRDRPNVMGVWAVSSLEVLHHLLIRRHPFPLMSMLTDMPVEFIAALKCASTRGTPSLEPSYMADVWIVCVLSPWVDGRIWRWSLYSLRRYHLRLAYLLSPRIIRRVVCSPFGGRGPRCGSRVVAGGTPPWPRPARSLATRPCTARAGCPGAGHASTSTRLRWSWRHYSCRWCRGWQCPRIGGRRGCRRLAARGWDVAGSHRPGPCFERLP